MKTIVGTALVILMTVSMAFSAGNSVLPKIRSVDGMQALPVQGMTMVESGGQVFFISQNGRYVIKGDMYDMWSGGERVPDIATLNATSSIINLDKIGVKMEDLFALKYGHGPEKVTVFVSPGCPYCKKLMQTMKTGELEDKYTFNIVPLPYMGKQSQIAVKKLVAAKGSNPQAALDALMSDNYGALPLKESNKLDLEGVKRSMLTAKIIGINQVPVLLSSAGVMQVGLPDSLPKWLEGVN